MSSAPECAEGKVIRRIFFDANLGIGDLCAGDETRLLRSAERIFHVHFTARENWVEIQGGSAEAERAELFLSELEKLRKLRNAQLSQRDFDFLCSTFRSRSENLVPELWKSRLEVGKHKPCVMPRSKRQMLYIDLMRRFDVVFGIGPAGTGKTYLAMAAAVSAYLKGEVSRIILTRPARESGERLGFLPGSLEEKVSPYLRPLYDALYDVLDYDEAQTLISRNIIEVAPLAFMRGRTLNNAFIILDEAQNTTVEQMLMFLTRMGFGSKCVVTGDPQQSDLHENERSGLKHALETLRDIPEIGFVLFDTGDVVRHRLLETIIRNYTSKENFRERQ